MHHSVCVDAVQSVKFWLFFEVECQQYCTKQAGNLSMLDSAQLDITPWAFKAYLMDVAEWKQG